MALNRVRSAGKFAASASLLCFCMGSTASAQYVDQQTGMPVVAPNSRQLTNPVSGQSTFNGFNRQLTDPATGQSTFNGYSIKLTDPQTGAPTFKGYGQNPLMQNRQSAPDFRWNSNVDSAGKSQYSGFGRDPLTTSEGRSTFIGNNRKLTDESGAPSFVGNNRQLADPHAREDFLKQSQNLRPIPGRQSYINGRAFPGAPELTPSVVPPGIQQVPVSTPASAAQSKENDNSTPVEKQGNHPAGSQSTEGGSGF